MSKDEDIRETRNTVAIRAGYRCEGCEAPLAADKGELAHKIANTRAALGKYGEEVIHHPLNLSWRCPGACNDAANIGNKPEAVRTLVKLIRMTILEDAAVRMMSTPHLYTDLFNRLGKVARGA